MPAYCLPECCREWPDLRLPLFVKTPLSLWDSSDLPIKGNMQPNVGRVRPPTVTEHVGVARTNNLVPVTADNAANIGNSVGELMARALR